MWSAGVGDEPLRRHHQWLHLFNQAAIDLLGQIRHITDHEDSHRHPLQSSDDGTRRRSWLISVDRPAESRSGRQGEQSGARAHGLRRRTAHPQCDGCGASTTSVSTTRVVDIGCGTGQTTRDAARAAVVGSVLGVDTSASAIERARELAAGERLHNVTHTVADAQVHSFDDEEFDVAISRFGTMFFAEPASAFRNIARALRPGARLVMMVWQDHDRNEWAVSIGNALAADQAPPPRPTDAMDPFSLGDPAAVTTILGAAGFIEFVVHRRSRARVLRPRRG